MREILLLIFVVTTSIVNSQEVKDSISKKPSFIISVGAGLAYRVENDPSGLDCQPEHYLKELNSGSSIDLTLYYGVPSVKTGFGLKYNMFKSTVSYGPTYIESPNGDVGEGTITDKVRIFFIGPSVCFLNGKSSKWGEPNFEFSIGYLEYNDSVEALGSYMIKGKSLGMITVVGYHFYITKNILIGPQFSFNFGILTKMTLEGQGENDYHAYIDLGNDYKESLMRFDLSVGLKVRI